MLPWVKNNHVKIKIQIISQSLCQPVKLTLLIYSLICKELFMFFYLFSDSFKIYIIN